MKSIETIGMVVGSIIGAILTGCLYNIQKVFLVLFL